MSVIAKFQVAALSKTLDASGGHISSHVVLMPAQGEDNKTWAQYTPNGKIEMWIDNPVAYEQFGDTPGKFFFVHFSEAPAKEADEPGRVGSEAPAEEAEEK